MKSHFRTHAWAYGFWLLCLLSCAIVGVSKNLESNHPNPEAARCNIYFPERGELRSDSEVGSSGNGYQPKQVPIRVPLDEFKKLAAESALHPLLVLNQPTFGKTIVDLFLSRGDSLYYYHATMNLPNIEWGKWGWLFATEWYHETGDAWLAVPSWNNLPVQICKYLFSVLAVISLLCALIAYINLKQVAKDVQDAMQRE